MESAKRRTFPLSQIVNKEGNPIPFTYSKQMTVTPSDTKDLIMPGSCLFLPVGGAVKITLTDDPEDHAGVVWTLPSGYHPLSVRRVWSTGTAAGLVIISIQ